MDTKKIAVIVFISFIILLLIAFIYFEPNILNAKNTEAPQVEESETSPTPKPGTDMKVDRIKTIEDALTSLKKDQDKQDSFIIDLSEKVNDLSTASALLAHKTILDTKQTQGASFSTSSNAYTSMNTFVNISCSEKCILWMNYFSSSKNDSSNNINTYGVFVNGVDKGIYSQGNISNADAVVPISLNASIPVSAGSYTVEMKAKTSGGTLQSDVSFLQVMAIEQ